MQATASAAEIAAAVATGKVSAVQRLPSMARARARARSPRDGRESVEALSRSPMRRPPPSPLPTAAPADFLELAVVGVHLSGMALNHELRAAGGV